MNQSICQYGQPCITNVIMVKGKILQLWCCWVFKQLCNDINTDININSHHRICIGIVLMSGSILGHIDINLWINIKNNIRMNSDVEIDVCLDVDVTTSYEISISLYQYPYRRSIATWILISAASSYIVFNIRINI